MPINECVYCGVVTDTASNVCSACATLVGPPPEAAPPSDFGQIVQGFGEIEHSGFVEHFPAPPEQFVPPPSDYQQPVQNVGGFTQTPPAEQYSPDAFAPPAPPVRTGGFTPPPRRDVAQPEFGGQPTSNCVLCQAEIPRGQRTCEKCMTKKTSPWVKRAVAVIVFLVAGYFGYNYGYDRVSANGVLHKYERVTGTGYEFKSLVFKGEGKVGNIVTNGTEIDFAQADGQGGTRFDFKIVTESSGKSAVVIDKGTTTIFKEVFDGVSGWELNGMNGSPVIKDKGNGFGMRKMGAGLEDYETAEFLDAATEESFAGGLTKVLRQIKQLKVGNDVVTVGERVAVKITATRNGQPDPTVILFDRDSGLMIGMVKQESMTDSGPASVILFDEYRKFPFKNTGVLSFLRSSQVTVPTKCTITIGTPPRAGSYFGTTPVMQYKIADIDFNGLVDPAIYAKPAA